MVLKKGRSTGFTLIELLVVIAIIAILAAILFPVFARAREMARKTSCSSNLKQFGNAFAMYRTDYDGRFPTAGWYGAGGNVSADMSSDWHIVLYPYIKNAQVYLCPSSTDIHDGGQDWNRTSTDYLYNNQLGPNKSGLNESAVVAVADCIQLIEGHSDWGRGNPCITPFSNGALSNNDRWCTEYSTFGNNGSLITGSLWTGSPGQLKVWGLPRHNDGGNVLFVDGHVKSYANWAAKSAADTVSKLEGQLPFSRNMNPYQNGGTWSATF